MDTIRTILIAILAIISAGYSGVVFAEESVNLRDMLAGAEGRQRLDLLEKIYDESLSTDDLDYQIRCLYELMDEARHQKMQREIGNALLLRTVLYYNNNLNDSIYLLVPQDLELLREYGLWTYYYEDWILLANSYIFEGNSRQGLEEVQRMFDDAMERHNNYGIGTAYYGMGNAYTQMNNWDECIASYEKSIEVLSGIRPRPVVLPEIYNYYGDALNDMEAYDKLEELTDRWKEFLIQFIEDSNQSFSGNADIYWSYYYIASTQAKLGLGKLDEAERMLAGAKEHIASDDDYVGMSWLFYKAQLLLQQGRYDEALTLNTRRMQLMEEYNDEGVFITVRKQRAQIMEGLGRYEEAARLYNEMYVLNDSINASETKRQLTIMNTQFHVGELKREKERAQFRWIITVGVIVLLSLAVFMVFRLRAAKRLKQAHQNLEEAHANLQDAYDQLEETTTAKERIESELRIARDIQMGMVPAEFPDRPDIDLYASMTPAKEVGGDLYDFLLLDDRLYFCVGDVSGKGVPASLFMSQATRLFSALAKQSLMPADIATRLNAELSENNENGMFVTMFIGMVDLTTGHLDFCNAGHNPPAIGEAQGTHHSSPLTYHFLEMEPNAPIGLWPELDYEGESIDSIIDQPLFIYTDGLNEAENAAQEQFGDDHLLEVLHQTPYENARQCIEVMREEVARHVAGAEPSDDLTMMCLKVKSEK